MGRVHITQSHRSDYAHAQDDRESQCRDDDDDDYFHCFVTATIYASQASLTLD